MNGKSGTEQEGERYPLHHRGSNNECQYYSRTTMVHVYIITNAFLTEEDKINITNIGHDPFFFGFCLF